MKILLTGATGFIGSKLAVRLEKEGHELSILVRLSSDLSVLQNILPKVQVCQYDGNFANLITVLKMAQPKLIIHVASLFLAQHKAVDVEGLIESNLKFPTQLLEAMSQLGIKFFINTGTSWQHYQNEFYSPVNLYAATKQAFAALLDYYVEAQGFKAITLKLFDTYGPGDFRPKLFTLLRKAAKTGEILRMSPGNQLLDIVYIDDVVDAYILSTKLITEVTKSECYAVSSPERLTLQNLVRIYGDIVRRHINVEWGGLPYRPREVFEPWTNYQLVPGWQSLIYLSDGVERMERDPHINGLLAGFVD